MEQNQMATPPQTDAGAMAVADSYSTMLTDPKVLNTLDKLAKFYATSQIVPQQFRGNVANCFVACEMANRMGVSPMFVMQNLSCLTLHKALKKRTRKKGGNNGTKPSDDSAE